MTVSFLKRDVLETSLSINSVNLNRVSHIKLLGITIQSDIKWDIHISGIGTKASRRLYTICILKKAGESVEDKVAVFNAYIRPILEYCSQVWNTSINTHQINVIEKVQKRNFK